jgi:hypothetical protein
VPEPPWASDECECTWGYISRSVDSLVGLLDGLDSPALNWRPPASGANSVYVLAMHILGNLVETLLGVVGGQPCARDRDGEFAAEGVPGVVVAERWHALRERIATVLRPLADEDMSAIRLHPRRGELPVREVFLVVARHTAEHLGHAQLTSDLRLAEIGR